MKFYVAGQLLEKVEEQNYTLLIGVRINTSKRGFIKREMWGSGWIYDAEESFRSWCVIGYGFDPIPIHDNEYLLLQTDGIVYLSKERTEEIVKPLQTQLSLIAINKR